MCGIAGFCGDGTKEQLESATDALAHRGPDDSGYLLQRHVGFGHRRLSIIDISSRGHQPMMLLDKSAAIIFNGEIYNYRELRDSLRTKGRVFVSDSDTEVLLYLYAEHGEEFLRDAIGMFALALYDFKEEKLILARDRMGEKPLYWSNQGGTFWFASEVKSLFAVGIRRDIDRNALQQYLAFDYVPTPQSMIFGVNKLEPGTLLIFRENEISKKKFWNPPEDASDFSESDALKRLDTLLTDSVKRQLVSDVPLGVFLSGGLDSSTIAYYAMSAGKEIDTFSIGFDEASFDESAYARTVAKHLGTNHHEEIMRSADALDLFSEIPDVFSEPVADASVIPTLFLSRFARKSVTVALGGDGGDELFAGYPTFQADSIFNLYRNFPLSMRRALTRMAGMLPVSHANSSISYNLKKFTGSGAENPIHRHLEWLGTFDKEGREMLLKKVDTSNVF